MSAIGEKFGRRVFSLGIAVVMTACLLLLRVYMIELKADELEDFKEYKVVCSGPTLPNVRTEPAFNILNFSRPSYLPNYRNPCWYKRIGPNNKSSDLFCIPLFYIVGQPKCGTTDLLTKLTSHPEISDRNSNSAQHWLSRLRFRMTYEFFGQLFTKNTRQVSRYARKQSKTRNYHPMIIGEGSPSTLTDNSHWREYVGNENCTAEPRVINSFYLKHMVPNAKVIITLRNPVSRLYSSYFYFLKGNLSAEHFHSKAVNETNMYTECFRTHGMRSCAYNNTLYYASSLKVNMGLYSVYLEDWFKTFPRKQMFVSFLEDYAKVGASVLRQMFRFLEVTPLREDKLRELTGGQRKNVGRVRSRAGPMLKETQLLLTKFYKPFEERLTQLLQENPNPL